jgi:hypothetical protein
MRSILAGAAILRPLPARILILLPQFRIARARVLVGNFKRVWYQVNYCKYGRYTGVAPAARVPAPRASSLAADFCLKISDSFIYLDSHLEGKG